MLQEGDGLPAHSGEKKRVLIPDRLALGILSAAGTCSLLLLAVSICFIPAPCPAFHVFDGIVTRGYAPTEGTTKHPTPQQQAGRASSSLRLCLLAAEGVWRKGARPYHLSPGQQPAAAERTKCTTDTSTHKTAAGEHALHASSTSGELFMSQLLVFHATKRCSAHLGAHGASHACPASRQLQQRRRLQNTPSAQCAPVQQIAAAQSCLLHLLLRETLSIRPCT